MNAFRQKDRWIVVFTLFIALAYNAIASSRATEGDESPPLRLLFAALAVLPAHLLVYHAGRLIPRGWPSARLAQHTVYALMYSAAAERVARNVLAMQGAGARLLVSLLAMIVVLAAMRRWPHAAERA